jgi:hypothetical protein
MLMGMLLAFAPFIVFVFVIVERAAGIAVGLFAAAAVSIAILARDTLIQRKSPKILEVGTLLLFGGLAIYALVAGAEMPIMGVRVLVDAGLLVIVLASIAVRRPFTLQYAREQVEPGLWGHPGFIRANYVITAAWALAFAVMVAADLAMLCLAGLPRWVGIAATIAALVGAVRFTQWYPARQRTAFAANSLGRG